MCAAADRVDGIIDAAPWRWGLADGSDSVLGLDAIGGGNGRASRRVNVSCCGRKSVLGGLLFAKQERHIAVHGGMRG
jgi:hypothetical protein